MKESYMKEDDVQHIHAKICAHTHYVYHTQVSKTDSAATHITHYVDTSAGIYQTALTHLIRCCTHTQLWHKSQAL